jgi:NADPH2 dehydrogenase
MYLQLWALGRAAHTDVLAEDGLPYVSASDVALPGGPAPRPLTVDEIEEYVQLYATAASNAVHKAGFDGVEIHAANGYLLDQFLHDRSNTRTDAYGGSPENRTRFPLEVIDAVVKAVGQNKTAIRFSPWGTYLGAFISIRFSSLFLTFLLDMYFADPKPTYAHLITELRNRYPDFEYLHVVEPRVDGTDNVDVKEGYSNDFIRDIWGDRRLISAGGYTRDTAIAAAEEKGDLIAFARPYIANVSFRLRCTLPILT